MTTHGFRDNHFEALPLEGLNYFPYRGDDSSHHLAYVPNSLQSTNMHLETTKLGTNSIWNPDVQGPWTFNGNNISTFSAPTQHVNDSTTRWIGDDVSAVEAQNISNSCLIGLDSPNLQDAHHQSPSLQMDVSPKEISSRRGQVEKHVSRSRRTMRKTK